MHAVVIARPVAYVTGTVDQELLARNEYLAAENRILKAQLNGRPRLSDAERGTLGEIGHRLGRKVLADVATVAGTVRISVCGRAVEHYAAMALMKRSPKMTANWALAMDHSRGGIFQSFSDRFKIR